MKKTCVQCGKDFEITAGEVSFYQEKGYELPKRCKECRDKNKANRRNNVRDTEKADNNNASNQEKLKKPETDQKNITNGQSQSPVEIKLSGGIGKYIAAVVVMLILCFGYTIWGGADTEKDGTDISSNVADTRQDNTSSTYSFRNEKYLSEHFEKHGKEFDYETKEEYEAGANRVIQSKDVLHKIEAEDGDDVYYVEDSNEFVIVSTDGYIRTYFKPSDGIDYYNRQ